MEALNVNTKQARRLFNIRAVAEAEIRRPVCILCYANYLRDIAARVTEQHNMNMFSRVGFNTSGKHAFLHFLFSVHFLPLSSHFPGLSLTYVPFPLV